MHCSDVGAFKEVLADALPRVSLDVVGVVAGYAVCEILVVGCVPKLQIQSDSEYRYQNCGLAKLPDGSIWCGDINGCQICTSDGEFLCRAAKEQLKRCCTGIAIDNNGEVFYSESDRHRIVVCGLDGAFVREFGSLGNDDGQFFFPCGLVVDGKGLLFVADSGNNRVQVLRREGSFVNSFGQRGSGDGQFDNPLGIAMSSCRELFITDASNSRVQVLCGMR